MTTLYDTYPKILAVIDAISLGNTETRACDDAGISVTAFKKHIASSPELQELYAEADQRGGDAMAEALIDIDNHKIHGQSDPRMAKIISDNIKWFLAKRKPKSYGDKIQVEHSVTLDVAITDALRNGRNRIGNLTESGHLIVDATYTDVEEDDLILQELLS